MSDTITVPISVTAALKIVLFVLLVSAVTAANAVAPDIRNRAAELANTHLARSGLPGLAVTIGLDGAMVWSQGFGLADVKSNVSVDPAKTMFRVGSVAKPMTAMAVAQLVEQGKLDLDVPVQRYVPGFPEKRGVITTRMLGGHLSGIRHYEGAEFLSQKHYGTVSEGLEIFATDSLVHDPGVAYLYSSYGWNLISAVVEGASGEPFLPYMSRHVFEPLQMIHTVADQAGEVIPDRTAFYVMSSTGLSLAPDVDNSYKWAGGGFLSTSEDLVRFGFAHLRPTMLQASTIRLLWTSQRTATGEATGYGIGWRVDMDPSKRNRVWHSGGSVGGTTYFALYPDHGLVVAMVSNMSNADFADLPVQMANLFLAGAAL